MMYLNSRLEFPASGSERFEGIRAKYSLRRTSPFFVRLITAADAVFGGEKPPENSGLIFATSFGPAEETEQNNYDLLDFPADQTAPGKFSNSVMNAPSSYLAIAFGIRGPVLTAEGFRSLRRSAAVTADSWLTAGFCPRLLLILADETCAFTRAAECGAGFGLMRNMLLLNLGAKPEQENAAPLDSAALAQILETFYTKECRKP